MTYDTITYDKFLAAVPHAAAERDWRYGQALFNLLCRVRPRLAEKVRATPLDPFYVERQYDVPAEFFELLASEWDFPYED
jgi:hypothetical protein